MITMDDVFKKEIRETYALDYDVINRLLVESKILHEIKDILNRKDDILTEIYGVPMIEGYSDIVGMIQDVLKEEQ